MIRLKPRLGYLNLDLGFDHNLDLELGSDHDLDLGSGFGLELDLGFGFENRGFRE